MSTETAHHFFKNCGGNSLYNGSNVDFQILKCEDYSRRDPSNIPINKNQKNLNPMNREAKSIKLFRIPIKDYSILNIIILMLNVFPSNSQLLNNKIINVRNAII